MMCALDKASLDIFWLKDESLEASDNLPDPDIIAQEIVEDLEAPLEQFREIVTDLSNGESSTSMMRIFITTEQQMLLGSYHTDPIK